METGTLELLLQKRSLRETEKITEEIGQWDFGIGGHRNSEETNKESAQRETQEETAEVLDLKKSRLIHFDSRVVGEVQPTPWFRTLYLYPVDERERELIQNGLIKNWLPTREVEAWQWFSLEGVNLQESGVFWSTVRDVLVEIPEFIKEVISKMGSFNFLLFEVAA